MWQWSLSLHHRKKLNIHDSAADLLHTVLELEISNSANVKSSHYRCFAKKGCFENLAKFTGNSCAWGNTYEFCKNFKSTFFTEELRTTASKSGYCNNEVESWMQCLLLWLKSQRAREESHHPAFISIFQTISHTY